MNLNGKLRKKMEGPNGRPSKNLGVHSLPSRPLRLATDGQSSYSTKLSAVGLQRHVVVMYVCGME